MLLSTMIQQRLEEKLKEAQRFKTTAAWGCSEIKRTIPDRDDLQFQCDRGELADAP